MKGTYNLRYGDKFIIEVKSVLRVHLGQGCYLSLQIVLFRTQQHVLLSHRHMIAVYLDRHKGAPR